MIQESPALHGEPPAQSTAHVVHALMQFFTAVRYRKNVLITALAVCALLGALYYATATRYYRADAALLVIPSRHEGGTISMPSEGGRPGSLMPTFENLFTSPKVVEGALEYLRPADRIDLVGAPPEAWVATLQKNLSANVVRGTHILEISYRSKDPKAAVSVVGAAVRSYNEFLDRSHKGTAGEIIRVLTEEKVRLVEKLDAKGVELIEARRRFGDLGIRSGGHVVHPVVQRAIYFNEALIEAQKKRVELEASLAAVEAAVRNGEDLQQHMMAVADVVGREILLRTLGINGRDSFALAQIERGMLEDRAELKAMREHLGPSHTEVVAKMDKIRMTEQYLLGYQDRVNARLAEIQNTQLGPMLVQMLRQKLSEAWQLETSLQTRFEQARDEAIDLNGRLAELEVIEHEVKWLRNLHDVLLNRIADIDLKQDGQEVRTAVVHEPVEVKTPISPDLRRVILMVLLGGTTVGLVLVYVLDVLDDRFRSVEEMQSHLSVPVLAVVRQLQPVEGHGAEAIQMHADANSAECEAFRTLRTALALADADAHQIVISSTEPGDGKTTVLANLAVASAQSGKRTLLIDADLRRPGLTALLGMRGSGGLSTVIRGETDVANMALAQIRPSGLEGLDVLSAGPRPTNPAELLASPRFSELLAWAETVYERIFIDSPPALATSDAAVIGRLVDGLILVVQPDKNRRRPVMRAAKGLSRLKIPLLGIVVNRVDCDQDRGYYGYGEGYTYGDGYDYEHTDGSDEAERGLRATTPPGRAA